MKVARRILSTIFIFASTELCANEPIYRYEYRQSDSKEVERPFAAGRVHIRYDREFEQWTMVLTNSKGGLPVHGEGITDGTVLDGERIGASKGARFLLGKDGRWRPTDEPEKLRVLVKGPTNRLITTTRVPTR